ncbi:rod shape-determining protein RodA [Patescibacteria group bacterium]|nr:rod shape-determining protein RodA [Patescibacteria group bacterium]MBU1472806.1 rod shape-determining protein RodA [Patescibacteria group bacterium]MBU2460386.1 rod shape-determining protein RodA [Patescibacteria group bacterium]MBU2544036.1 rod shape-determining protein RodA [Patescibacteria group bacterium]
MGRKTHYFDWVIALLFLCLGAFGLFLLLTIDKALGLQQFMFLVIGFGLLYAVSRLDKAVLWWFAPVGYVLAIIFLASSFAGPSIRGATRWIFVGAVQLQPSEIVKPFILLAVARAITVWSPRNIRSFPILMALCVLPLLLIFRQPDLGTSIIYASAFVSMILAAGISVKLFIAATLVPGLLFPFLWHLLAPYQQNRILTFLNPGLDPRGAGYNAMQSMIAVGSGQLFGRGLGRGTQSHLRFLPEFHTDFIFATLIEELGLFGGLLLISFYAALLWRIIKPYLQGPIDDVFSYTYAIGLFGMLLVQLFINTGMNMGIVPITGITLPFVSYGGSSLLSLSISLGVLMALRGSRSGTDVIAIGASD